MIRLGVSIEAFRRREINTRLKLFSCILFSLWVQGSLLLAAKDGINPAPNLQAIETVNDLNLELDSDLSSNVSVITTRNRQSSPRDENEEAFTEVKSYQVTCGQTYLVNGISLPNFILTCSDDYPRVSTLKVTSRRTNFFCRKENPEVPQASDRYFEGIRIVQYDAQQKVVSWAIFSMINNQLTLDIYDESNQPQFRIREAYGDPLGNVFNIENKEGRLIARAKRVAENDGKATLVFCRNSRKAASYHYAHENYENAFLDLNQETLPSGEATLQIFGLNDQIDTRAVQFLPVGLSVKFRMIRKELVSRSIAKQRWLMAKRLSFNTLVFSGKVLCKIADAIYENYSDETENEGVRTPPVIEAYMIRPGETIRIPVTIYQSQKR